MTPGICKHYTCFRCDISSKNVVDDKLFHQCRKCSNVIHIFCILDSARFDVKRNRLVCCASCMNPNDVVDLKRGAGGCMLVNVGGRWLSECNVSLSREAKLHLFEQHIKNKPGPRGLLLKPQNGVWRFHNGIESGIRTTNYSDEMALRILESNFTTLFAEKEKLIGRTVDYSRSRTKFFFGYRYKYGEAGKSALYDDVEPFENEKYPFISNLGKMLKEKLNLKIDFNQCVINVYMAQSASLGVHLDDESIFHFPVVSLRLFDACKLSFGCQGHGRVETAYFFEVLQRRGTITVLDGIAARGFKHCIRPDKNRDFSVSFIFRKVKLSQLVKHTSSLQGVEIPTEPRQAKKRVRDLSVCVPKTDSKKVWNGSRYPPGKSRIRVKWITKCGDKDTYQWYNGRVVFLQGKLKVIYDDGNVHDFDPNVIWEEIRSSKVPQDVIDLTT